MASEEQDITDMMPDEKGVYRPKEEVQTQKEKIEEAKENIEEARNPKNSEESQPDILYAKITPTGETQYNAPPSTTRTTQTEIPDEQEKSEGSVGISRSEQLQRKIDSMKKRRQG